MHMSNSLFVRSGVSIASLGVVVALTPMAHAESPSPSPSPTATPKYSDCGRGAALRPYAPTITAQRPVTVTAFAAPGTHIDLTASDAQAGRRTVRTATADDQGQVSFVVRPVVNTTLYAQQDPEPCADPVFGENRDPVLVRTALSLGAVRNAPRDYTFTGRAFPARTGPRRHRSADGNSKGDERRHVAHRPPLHGQRPLRLRCTDPRRQAQRGRRQQRSLDADLLVALHGDRLASGVGE
jgi:hypothetical protein